MWPRCPFEEELVSTAGSGVGIQASSVLLFCGELSHPRSHPTQGGPNPVTDECKDEKAWPLQSNMGQLQQATIAPELLRGPLKLLHLHQSSASVPPFPGSPFQESFLTNILNTKLCRVCLLAKPHWDISSHLPPCKANLTCGSTTDLSLSEIQRLDQFPKP